MTTNTPQSFKDKWEKNQDLAFQSTLTEGSDLQKWILTRNGFESLKEFSDYLSKKKRVLDGGCGNGRVTALLRMITNPDNTQVVGIDLVAAEVAKNNLSASKNVKFFKKDLLEDLSDLEKFDFIYCQEVLHHTSNPQASFKNLCSLLTDDGEIAIYVYKKKSPTREFTDDYIRDRISDLPYNEAIKVCDQITNFGKALSDANLKVKVPGIDILDIPAGEYDVQRLLYNFFFKCFWSNEMSFKDNSVVNYDWYHPQIATRHTLDEVKGWYKDSNLKIIHECVDPYGITIRGVKA